MTDSLRNCSCHFPISMQIHPSARLISLIRETRREGHYSFFMVETVPLPIICCCAVSSWRISISMRLTQSDIRERVMKSVCLSPRGYDYGRWAGEVIEKIGYDRIACFGGSFGGGILAKLLCTAPQKVEKAVFIVPAGIHNAVPVSSVRMMIPLLQYRITKKEKYLIKTALYMALHREVLDKDTLDILKDSFEHVKTKVGMPTNIERRKLSGYHAPTLVIASEKDCLFPAKKVLPRAKQLFPNCKVYELKDSGHMHVLPEKVKGWIVDFLK